MGSSLAEVAFDVGAPVWALAWCPSAPNPPGIDSQTHPQYLAVGTYPATKPYVKVGEVVNGKGVIQIWAVAPGEAVLPIKPQLSHIGSTTSGERQQLAGNRKDSARNRKRKSSNFDHQGQEEAANRGQFENSARDSSEAAEQGTNGASIWDSPGSEGEGRPGKHAQIKELSRGLRAWRAFDIEHGGGLVRDLKWRPMNVRTDPARMSDGGSPLDQSLRKESTSSSLGFLAAALGDGSVVVYEVPLPPSPTVAQASGEANTTTNLPPQPADVERTTRQETHSSQHESVDSSTTPKVIFTSRGGTRTRRWFHGA